MLGVLSSTLTSGTPGRCQSVRWCKENRDILLAEAFGTQLAGAGPVRTSLSGKNMETREVRSQSAWSTVMINEQVLEGNWNEIKGKLRTHWGQLTDDDLTHFHGEVDKLVGTIQRKTGEGREAIEKYLNELSGSAASAFGQSAESLRQYTQRAAETVQTTARQAADQVRSGYIEAERFVHDRPRESLAICFGVGLVTGVLVAMLINSK
jgi:uncharacterized protein YjbJ (UPF0337 family)